MGNEIKMQVSENSTEVNHSPPGDLSDPVKEEKWKQTHERMMLYLRSLDAPFRRGLVLALEALEVAQEKAQTRDSKECIPEGMQALKRLMADYGLFSSEGPDYGEWFKYRSRCSGPIDGKDLSGGLRSMPPLNRGSMKPEKVA